MMDENPYSMSKLGAQFKIARESQNLSQKEVAARLHFNLDIIQILEGESTKNLPPLTFLRGYIRSYGKLLNFTEEDINQALAEAGFSLKTETATTPRLNMGTFEKNDPYIHWSTTLILAILFVLVGIWWTTHGRENTTPDKTTPAVVVQQALPTQTPLPPATAPAATALATPAASAPPSSPSAAPIATPTMTASVPASSNNIQPAPPAPAQQITSPLAAPAAVTPPALAATPALPSGQASAEPTKPPVRKKNAQDNHVSGVAMDLPEPGL